MLGIALLVVAMAAGAAALRPLKDVPENHALAGLFGEPERERAIAARAARLIAGSEAYLRMSGFADELARQAWKGMPFTVRRVSARWAEWVFADGHRWVVCHEGRTPRLMRRMIVSEATADAGRLVVGAYSPGGGPARSTLLIRDAREPADMPS